GGFVWVPYISDLETDLLAWTLKEIKKTRAHSGPMNNASGEMHLSRVHYEAGRLMTRCVQVSAPHVCDAEAGAPALQDSS
ncbi:MAG: hypothetical protein AAF768_04865, partial [Pseudomonadota bacterium]